MASPRRHSAFTLMELLLVVLLIAILSGGAVVNLRGRSRAKALEFAAKDLATAMEHGVFRSSQNGVLCRLAFDGQWRAYRLEETPRTGTGEYWPLPGPAGRWRRLPKESFIVEIRRGERPLDPLPATISLTSDADGFSGTIGLRNADGDSARVSVEPITRRVTYER